ncbi:hypothetical protein FOMG_13072 [Fusarium oxysporum f. sp. melonis 26406]|nr:hypothetical protein FOMG_13072 [Fusarium oxysporum f. sp. melonis 26406]
MSTTVITQGLSYVELRMHLQLLLCQVINRKAQRQPNPPNMKPRRKARKLKSPLMPTDSTAEAAGTPIISPSVPPMLLHSFLST